MCVLSTLACVCVCMHRCIRLYKQAVFFTCMHVETRSWWSGVFLNSSLPYVLRQGLSLNLTHTDSVKFSVQQATGLLLTLPAQGWDYRGLLFSLWALGMGNQNLLLVSKHITYWTIFFFSFCNDNFQPTISLYSIWERNKVRLAGNLSCWETTDLAWISAEQMVYFSTLSYWTSTSFQSPFDFDYWKKNTTW